MKFVSYLALSAVLFCSLATAAQTRKRIAFKRNSAEVSATIRGAQTLEYVFRVRRDADLEIWIDHTDAASAAYPKFVLYKPDGTLFYDENSGSFGGLSDMMDILPEAGDYTLRMQLPEETRVADKPVKFTLRLQLK